MTNAADALIALIENWSISNGQTIFQSRTDDGDSSETFTRSRAALRLIDSIEGELRGLQALGEPVEPFLECVPAWCEAILQPSVNWSQASNGNRVLLQPSDMRYLRMTAAHLRAVGLRSQLAEGDAAQIRAAVSVLESLIKEAAGLAPAAKAYLLGLAQDVLWYLDHLNEFGVDVLRQTSHELGGAVEVVAESGILPPQDVPKWRAAAKKIVVTFSLSAVAAIGGAVGGAASDHMLGPASSPTVVIEAPPGLHADTDQDSPQTQHDHGDTDSASGSKIGTS